MKKLKFFVVFLLAFVFIISTLTSCSRYVVERYGGGCGVWYPKKFNPNRGSRYENPRGALGW